MLNDDIIDLILQGVTDQQDLATKLKNLGYELTQSKISRKLKQLGITKSQGVYKISETQNIITEVKITFAPPNLIVVSTLPGHAGLIASAIDKQLVEIKEHQEFIGCIAGDDTIFIAVDLATQTQINAINKVKSIISSLS